MAQCLQRDFGLAAAFPARYERPASLDAALRLLDRGPWQLLAGGTDVYPAHVGKPVAAPLLDLTGIAALRGIRRDDRGHWFGATTTWTDVLDADLPPVFDALKRAAREIGGVQIQNRGTLAGNLCNASPAADGTPVWLALDADVVLGSATGERRLPVAGFVLGSRRTALAPGEIVLGLHVPARRGAASRSHFQKLGGRRYLVISVTMVALAVDLDADARIVQAGVAVGSCSARAMRLTSLERRIAGRRLDEVEVLPDDVATLMPIDDLRGSGAYRRDATATLLRRAFAALAS
ncbi:MAG: FAD binding domain-containing protein [Proteobacteria bacterium]|nr:FAD binding domain-containing protein [Pseudomonadota bacterium]